jgi:hypothetical protein
VAARRLDLCGKVEEAVGAGRSEQRPARRKRRGSFPGFQSGEVLIRDRDVGRG